MGKFVLCVSYGSNLVIWPMTVKISYRLLLKRLPLAHSSILVECWLTTDTSFLSWPLGSLLLIYVYPLVGAMLFGCYNFVVKFWNQAMSILHIYSLSPLFYLFEVPCSSIWIVAPAFPSLQQKQLGMDRISWDLQISLWGIVYCCLTATNSSNPWTWYVFPFTVVLSNFFNSILQF